MTKGLSVVDIPGHENFKSDAIKEVSTAKGVVFLCDTRSRQNIYKNALYLYDFFVSKAIQQLNIPLLIVSNFSDCPESLKVNELKEELEKEM